MSFRTYQQSFTGSVLWYLLILYKRITDSGGVAKLWGLILAQNFGSWWLIQIRIVLDIWSFISNKIIQLLSETPLCKHRETSQRGSYGADIRGMHAHDSHHKAEWLCAPYLSSEGALHEAWLLPRGLYMIYAGAQPFVVKVFGNAYFRTYEVESS